MKVYKIKCLNCKEKTQLIDIKKLFIYGCPFCKSKRIKLLGYETETEGFI